MYDEIEDEDGEGWAAREESEEGDLWETLVEPEMCETRCYLITGQTRELNALERVVRQGRGVLHGEAARERLRVEVLASWLGGLR